MPIQLPFYEHYLKIFGTMCCTVPNITLSLFCQFKKMKSAMIIKIVLLILAIHLSVIGLIKAQPGKIGAPNSELYKEIAKMDSVLFGAFNSRDTAQFKKMFTPDLEFYHDKDGLTGYDRTIEFMRETVRANNGLNRQLVKGTLEVYPIPGYGAMEIGSHRFCHMENGQEDCGTFRFVHIWVKKDGNWKISRVMSYGHKIQTQ